MSKDRPTLRGHELSVAELRTMKKQIENLETIRRSDPEIYQIVADRWPELLSKSFWSGRDD